MIELIEVNKLKVMIKDLMEDEIIFDGWVKDYETLRTKLNSLEAQTECNVVFEVFPVLDKDETLYCQVYAHLHGDLYLWDWIKDYIYNEFKGAG